MILQPEWRIIVVATGVLLFSACAQSPTSSSASRAPKHCPAGSTLTCEANTIGRIKHGTFAKNNDKCACVQEGTRSLNSPVIPGIH